MQVTPIKTTPIRANEQTMDQVLDVAISNMEENQILVVTSKIVSLCEGRALPIEGNDRDALVAQEADYYLPREYNKYGFCMSINHHTMIASAGIDHSNGDGNFTLWPKDPQQSVNAIREYLVKRFNVTHVGVVMTDSHLQPFRWGTVGTAIAHTGFKALNDYRGTPDIFGRKLEVSQSNVAEGIAAASVVCMGEGAEQTPMTVVSDVPFVQFQDRNPTQEELDFLAISKEEDVFESLFSSLPWVRGKNNTI